MKKVISVLGLTLVFAVFNISLIYAADIFVNGTALDVRSRVINSRTLVPVRGVFEALNFDVSWEAESRTAVLYNRFSKETVVIPAGSNNFSLNGSVITPDVPQTLINGSLYIPLRAISESINAEVYWNSSTGDITISRGDNIVFVDDEMEAFVKDTVGKDTLTVEDLNGIKQIEPSDGYEIHSLEDMVMLNYVDSLVLVNQPITDFTPVVESLKYNLSYTYEEGNEDELFSFAEIAVAGCNDLDLKTLRGIDCLSLSADETQVGKIENVNVKCLKIIDGGSGNKIVLGDIVKNFPTINMLSIPDVKIADVENIVLLKGFSAVWLPYDYTLTSYMDFDKYAAQYITYYNKIQNVIAFVKAAGSSDEQRIKAAHDYIINNARYDVEAYELGDIPDEDYAPYGVFVNGKGVCQSYAEAFKIIMDEVGIECYFVTGEALDNGEWGGHAWNIVKAGDKFRHIDLTYDDPIYYVNGVLTDIIRYDYYLLTDAEMEKDHKWAAGSYKACG